MRIAPLSAKKKRTLLALLLLFSVLLAALAGVLTYRAREEERRLRAEQAEASREADRLLALATTAPPPPEHRGLSLLAAGDEDLRIFYLGGRTAYGLGAGALSLDTHSWRTCLRDSLRETLGYPLVGFVSERYAPCPSFAEAELEFREAYRDFPGFRLAVIAPERKMLGPAPGSFAYGLETLLIAMREEAPYTDILLVVPPGADGEEATAILALATHYGLPVTDTRLPLADHLGEGGAPTAEGHTIMAELILEALLSAAEEPPPYITPDSRLYP